MYVDNQSVSIMKSMAANHMEDVQLHVKSNPATTILNPIFKKHAYLNRKHP